MVFSYGKRSQHFFLRRHLILQRKPFFWVKTCHHSVKRKSFFSYTPMFNCTHTVYIIPCVLRVSWSVSAFQRYDSAVTEWGGGGVVVEELLVQQAAIFSCTISCSIIVPWITSIAGDNRQAAERSGWYRTPTPLWETIWIISCLPADCLWGLGASDVWAGVCVSGVGGGCQCYDSVWLYR